MITPDYSIVPSVIDGLDESSCRLFIKMNERLLHYIIVDGNNTVAVLKYYHIVQGGPSVGDWLDELMVVDGLLSKQWSSVKIIYTVPEAQLVPSFLQYDRCSFELAELVAGNLRRGITLTGKAEGVDIYAVYQVPPAIHRFFKEQFPAAHIVHYYDLLVLTEDQQEGVYAEFYPSELLVKIIKNGQLQLIQNYTYQTPEDAAFYLLSLYAMCDFSPEELPLQISGMIVADSAVYNELLKYFRTIEAAVAPASIALSNGFEDYPAHFFSPAFNLVLCAS